MVELLQTARRPLEALLGVSEVGHDEALLPAAPFGAGTSQVGGWRRAVVHVAQQVAQFVGSHDDAGEAAGVLDDRHRVHLGEPLVHHTGAADVREACVGG